jgi:hypothetical protein
MKYIQRKLSDALAACRDVDARRAIELAMAALDTDFYTTKLLGLVCQGLAERRIELQEGFLVQRTTGGDIFRLYRGQDVSGLLPVLGDTPTATCILWALDKQSTLRVKVDLRGTWSIQRDGVDIYVASSCAELFEQYLEVALKKT